MPSFRPLDPPPSRLSLRLKVAVVPVVLTVLAFIAVFIAYRFARNMNSENCENNLHQVGLAILQYETDHQHEYPESFQQLILVENLNPICLTCPASDETEATGPTTQAVADDLMRGKHLSYIYVGHGLTDAVATTKTVVAFEPLKNHGGGMHVLFGDGHCEWVDRNIGQIITNLAAAGKRPVTLP